MSTIHICFSSDNNYAQHLAVSIASILHHKGEEHIVIYVLDGGISDANKSFLHAMVAGKGTEIYFVTVDGEAFRSAPIQTIQGAVAHVTLATYFRLLLQDLLPEVDKVIYLDCDLICRSSLLPLYQENMGSDWIRGVIDIDHAKHTVRLDIQNYICAGVLLLNLRAWRENEVEQKCMDFIRDHADRIVLHDQDVLNVVCQECLSYLAPTWNAQACDTRLGRDSGFNELAKTANIIHFIGGRKPWHPGCRHPFRKEYFRYLRMTPYRDFEKHFFWMKVRYFFWHTKYSHGRKRWYACGVKVWQKKCSATK